MYDNSSPPVFIYSHGEVSNPNKTYKARFTTTPIVWFVSNKNIFYQHWSTGLNIIKTLKEEYNKTGRFFGNMDWQTTKKAFKRKMKSVYKKTYLEVAKSFPGEEPDEIYPEMVDDIIVEPQYYNTPQWYYTMTRTRRTADAYTAPWMKELGVYLFINGEWVLYSEYLSRLQLYGKNKRKFTKTQSSLIIKPTDVNFSLDNIFDAYEILFGKYPETIFSYSCRSKIRHKDRYSDLTKELYGDVLYPELSTIPSGSGNSSGWSSIEFID